jgi:hypothetical protein
MFVDFLSLLHLDLVNNVNLAKESFELSEFVPAFIVVMIEITCVTTCIEQQQQQLSSSSSAYSLFCFVCYQ